MLDEPVGQGRHPCREEVDVEPEHAGPDVELLLPRREQVGEDRHQAGSLQLAGHVAVAGAVAAAAAAVSEQHDTKRRLGYDDVGRQDDVAGGDLQAVADDTHGRSGW